MDQKNIRRWNKQQKYKNESGCSEEDNPIHLRKISRLQLRIFLALYLLNLSFNKNARTGFKFPVRAFFILKFGKTADRYA